MSKVKRVYLTQKPDHATCMRRMTSGHMKLAAVVKYSEGSETVQIRRYIGTRNADEMHIKSINDADWHQITSSEFRARSIFELQKIQ